MVKVIRFHYKRGNYIITEICMVFQTYERLYSARIPNSHIMDQRDAI